MSRGKSSTSGTSRDRLDLAGRMLQGQPLRAEVGGAVPLLVAAHAADRLARLEDGEAVHPLHGHVVLIQGHEEERLAAAALP